MRAIILAAGRGERMGDLTQHTPKPLIKAGGRYLIEYAITALVKFGMKDIVINICYHADQIKKVLGNGELYGANFHYSEEAVALETGGGIYQALPLLGSEPFIVLSSDIVTDYALSKLPKEPVGLAHLVLVDNPRFHPSGDFCLQGQRIYHGKENTLTFANIGVYRPELFADCQPGRFRLGELLKREITNQKVTGEHHTGLWYNIGSPQELAVFNALPVHSFINPENL